MYLDPNRLLPSTAFAGGALIESGKPLQMSGRIVPSGALARKMTAGPQKQPGTVAQVALSSWSSHKGGAHGVDRSPVS